MRKKDKDEIAGIKRLQRGRRELLHVAAGEEDVVEAAIRRAMARCRQRIRKVAGARSPLRQQRLAANRFARERARLLKKEFSRKRSWAIPLGELVRCRIDSPLLDQLDPDRPALWKPIVSRNFRREPNRVKVGKLNFLDNPIETINEFRRISLAEREEVRAFLDFSDTQCEDVGAYLVFAEIWPQLSKVFAGGRMSRAVQKVLSAIHVDQELGLGLGGVRDHSDVWAFPVKHRRPRNTTSSPTANLQPQDREKVADQLCELIDEWLEVANQVAANNGGAAWELSDEGKSLIARMSGELLDNAERHSLPDSLDGDWSMTAFMALRRDEHGDPILRCYLAFLNVGQSIAQSMERAPKSLLKPAARYVDQFGRRGPSRGTLLTVLALQDAITSNADASAAGRGGTGLQDVLEFVSDLGAASQSGADVRMTIVSGKSCIRLRHPNLLGARDPSGKRVQWCNPWNDPTRPPDNSTAFDLPHHFAGTLVSAGFTLDAQLFVAEDAE
ncbi:hypothetical protein ACXYL9_05820 [Qipengyuania sp. CAU 1752]